MSVDLLERAVAALGVLSGRVVFVGGATIGLWFTDPMARLPRMTYDVDVVIGADARSRAATVTVPRFRQITSA